MIADQEAWHVSYTVAIAKSQAVCANALHRGDTHKFTPLNSLGGSKAV
ncbi:MAG: hypothetical protein ACJ71G_08065 [Nitrososphaeraceae archaeon]